MKANELRLGTLLDVNGQTVKVLSIDEDGFMCEPINNEEVNHEAGDVVEKKPIPLTEEWLLKFGFKKWSNKKMWTQGKITIYYMKRKECFGYGKSFLELKVNYVHQLQNIFQALTGEELTITE